MKVNVVLLQKFLFTPSCDNGKFETLNNIINEFCNCQGVSDVVISLSFLDFNLSLKGSSVYLSWRVAPS